MNPLIPSKIDPCPVIESIMEIRFKRKDSVILEEILTVLRSKTGFANTKKLPQANIPDELINIEKPQADLRHNIHYAEA